LIRYHDIPFGGKLDCFLTPELINRIYGITLRPDQCPFHVFSFLIPSSTLISGIQNPVANSRCSTSIRCVRTSSRLLGGRPFRRSRRSCSSSVVSRWIYLLVSVYQPLRCRGELQICTQLGSYLFTYSTISLSETGPVASFAHSWKNNTRLAAKCHSYQRNPTFKGPRYPYLLTIALPPSVCSCANPSQLVLPDPRGL
jgi:hypothetical protein